MTNRSTASPIMNDIWCIVKLAVDTKYELMYDNRNNNLSKLIGKPKASPLFEKELARSFFAPEDASHFKTKTIKEGAKNGSGKNCFSDKMCSHRKWYR
jgi:hypothetical protein